MSAKQGSDGAKPRISNLKLAIGAASLFLFIVGVKRTFRTDEGKEIRSTRRGALAPGDEELE